MDFKTFRNVDVAGYIHDADVLIDLSHVKGHGVCGFGGAVKNISMGCVSDRTRRQIHSLEGGLNWDSDKCIRCGVCVDNCNHSALSSLTPDVLRISSKAWRSARKNVWSTLHLVPSITSIS